MSWENVSDTPQRASENYESLKKCTKRGSDTYMGSGVRWEDHPFEPAELGYWVSRPDCYSCGSDDVLVIYLTYIGGLGTGKDLNVEVVCEECGKFSYHQYTK